MRLSPLMSVYLGRQFLAGIGTILAICVCLILIFDIVELSRRAADRPAVTFGLVVEMAMLKLPTLMMKVLPFAVLIGGMLTFARLTRSNELVVARAAGVSVWQFLTPALVLAFLIGAFAVTSFNPLASAMGARYENLEARYLKHRPSLLAVQSSGLWLRQSDERGQSVIHAAKVAANGTEFRDVTIFKYEGSDRFAGRIDARTARLEAGRWSLDDALLSWPDRPSERRDHHDLDTSLTLGQIQESFAAPETLSFWSLPAFIRTLEEAGFSAVRHRLHWHSLLADPLLLCAMVLIAAAFSLRMTRRGGTGLLLIGGLLAGFMFYVLGDVVRAYGMSGNLPAVLAAWTPAGVTLMLGLASLFHLEDG